MIDIPAETTISHYAIPARNLLMGCEASFFSAQPSNLDIARCSQHVSSGLRTDHALFGSNARQLRYLLAGIA
jgi:hypothetical protein